MEVTILRDVLGSIRSVDGPLEGLLGWRPEQLVGLSSTNLIHPTDEAGAVTTWLAMLTARSTRMWRGRYRHAGGAWIWVETENTPLTDSEMISTLMRPLSEEELADELERQTREQVLSKLADALPVGVFEIDAGRRFRFTNDRLWAVVGAAPAATLEAALATLAPDDRPALEAALGKVSEGLGVDDLEVRVLATADAVAAGAGRGRVLSLSFRPLTDPDGQVCGAVGCLNDVTDRVEVRRDLEAKASLDGLTRCHNRASIMETLSRTMAEPSEMLRGVAVMYVDLDDLKEVNDRFGHPAGDAVLVAAAERLAGAVRDRDRVGRIGGDEFLLVCPDVPSPALARKIGERIRAKVSGPVSVGPSLVELRASFGVAWTDRQVDVDELVARADREMYREKGVRRPSAAPSEVAASGAG